MKFTRHSTLCFSKVRLGKSGSMIRLILMISVSLFFRQ